MAYGISHSEAGFRIALALRLFHLRKFIAPPKGFIIDSMTFKYRRKITITEQSGNSLSDYQVRIDLDATNFDFSHFLNEGKDLRFTDANGNLLPYWVEKMDIAAEEATIWVKVPTIPANSSVDIYMYYSSGVVDASDGDTTFEFFDDFKPKAWRRLAKMPAPRADLAAAVLNGKIYLIGGYNITGSDERAEVWEYDPVTNTYTQKASMNYARWGMIAVACNGLIYVFGGSSYGEVCEVYNPKTDSWTVMATPIPAGIRYVGVMGVTDGTYIYLYGQNYLYRYDPATDTYTLLNNSPPYDLDIWGVMAYKDRKIYILTGHKDEAKDYVMIYDLDTDTWTTGTPAPVRLYGSVRENPIVGDKIYVIQGQREGGEFFSRVFIYDIKNDSWSWGRLGYWDADGVAGGVLNGKIYTFGGRREVVEPHGTDFAGVFDPSAPDASAKWIDDLPGNFLINEENALFYHNPIRRPQIRTAKTLPAEIAVHTKLKYTGTAGGGCVVIHANNGVYGNDLNGYLMPHIGIGAGQDSIYREDGASWTQLDAADLASANEWHKYISITDGATLKVIRDGALILSAADETYRGGFIHIIQDDTVEMAVDLIFVRKYTEPEPSVSIGEEENA